MTINVLWLAEAGIFCAADSRLSSGDSTVTDIGVKIFPLPVVVRSRDSESGKTEIVERFTVGFAYAGSSISAINSLAVATACTQNIIRSQAVPVSVEDVAEIVRKVSQEVVGDVAGRLREGKLGEFSAFVFGYCQRSHLFQAFEIAAVHSPGSCFSMEKIRLVLEIGRCSVMGSGRDAFSRALEGGSENTVYPNMLYAIRGIFEAEGVVGVGGSLQIGLAERCGFEMRPILDLDTSDGKVVMNFLGIPINRLRIQGYDIGHIAYSADV